jgi:hypothetical protein
MTDRELLVAAAKAAGHGDVWSLDEHPDVTYIGPRYDGGTVRYRVWNPLTDDGDALRLAVKLRIDLSIWPDKACVQSVGGVLLDQPIFENGDPYAATRRAIVRAAAEIGRETK